MVKLMPRPPNPGDKAPLFRAILPQSRPSCFRKETDLPLMPGIKPPLLFYLYGNLVTMVDIPFPLLFKKYLGNSYTIGCLKY